MQSIINLLSLEIGQFIHKVYNIELKSDVLLFQMTSKDHKGDITLMVFPLTKFIKENPEKLAHDIGANLLQAALIEQYNVIKGFLNIELTQNSWNEIFQNLATISQTNHKEKIVLEYCGPNTNKPLHIGHLRNMFLGFSMARILEEYGHEVHKVNIYNDRGIAICKSMIAYKLYGNNETPASMNKKGDFFVGDFYVKYNEIYTQQVHSLTEKGMDQKKAAIEAPIYLDAQEMLLQWEEGNKEVKELWSKMNQWVYEGLHETYKLLEIDFEKEYYESEVYLEGKDIVEIGYQNGIFKKNESGAYYIDLTDKGMDQKIVQRADGTSIYITQDIALIQKRIDDYQMDQMIYVVGDEQNYHFKVLQEINSALNLQQAKPIYHLSYGMVTAKDGSKFKSREGTAADADDIIQSVIEAAHFQTIESGKAALFSKEELNELSKIIGIGALKYVMLRVNPKKSIPFDPKETVDLHGDTGAFIQYAFVRTQAILNKATIAEPKFNATNNYKLASIVKEEKDLISHLATFNKSLENACIKYDPSEIAQFALQLAKTFNRFYTQQSILNEENVDIRWQRLQLTYWVNFYLKKSLNLMGIHAPNKM